MFDIKAFIQDQFTSVEGLVTSFRKAGIEPPRHETAAKWLARESVPAGWLIKALVVAERQRGRPVSLTKYYEGAHSA